MNDKLLYLKAWLEHEMTVGYGGNPYVSDPEREGAWDSRRDTLDEVLEQVRDLLKDEK